jgi:hypothetical protein
MKQPEKIQNKKTVKSAQEARSLPSQTGKTCPRAEKDCSTCKITDCPEEEV